MPNLKLFNRRKSSRSALDIASEQSAPAQSSFKVLERPDKAAHNFDGKAVNRPFDSPLQQVRGGSPSNLGLGPDRSVEHIKSLDPNWALKRDRGSGGTTNSSSSGYYESSAASARHSSSSTLPSSLDQEREPEDEELFVHKAATTPMYYSASARADDALPPPPSFKSRAVRAISFGQKHNRANSIAHDGEPTSPVKGASRGSDQPYSPQRDRSTTTSSYASTAVPTKVEPNLSLGTSGFGDDFGNMFDGIGKSAGRSREDLPLPPPPAVGSFHRTESEPMFPPRSYSRQAFTPSPNALRNARDDAGSPYSWDKRDSRDGLIPSSALSSPRFDDGPPVPAHGNGMAPAFLGRSKGYAPVPDRNTSPGLERTSSDSQNGFILYNEKEQGYNNRQTHLDDGDRWSKKVELRDAPVSNSSNPTSSQSFKTLSSSTAFGRRPQEQVSAGATRSGGTSPGEEDEGPLFGTESRNATPKAAKSAIHNFQDAPLFDSSPQGPASRAIKPGHYRTESGTPKKMTKAQFEKAQRSNDSSLQHSEDETHLEDEYDDEDDIERTKQLTAQRRKQEANMAVYRQQMKKVTGGGPSDLPNGVRASMDRHSNSAPAAGMSSLHLGGTGGTPPSETVRSNQIDDDGKYDDVPLLVLHAHGFPSASKPPTQPGENDAQRRPSVAGSVMNGGAGQGNLPPFARRLPADPYFGASLINQSNREPLSFGGSQSVYGGAAMPPQQSPMGLPGGLVGVIAGEERAKAARRGSPNPVTGTYNPLPSNMPGQMPGQMPAMPRTMSMGSAVAPQVYTPRGYSAGMPPMPGMPMMMPPQDQTQQQMQQFMQMQMQVMQNMLAMQQQMTPQPMQQQATDYLGVPLAGQRPMSMASQAQSFMNGAPGQPRAMTMMSPPAQWDLGQGQQRPASAMPGYAPSTHGLNVPGGPGPGYTPSIAPSERSNVGMPSRYRPVQTNGDAGTGRSHSMTSSMTLHAFTNRQGSPNLQPPESQQGQRQSTIRIIDKPKGSPKVTARAIDADEDEDDGWAEMAKKRNEKKFSWRKKDNKTGQEPTLSDLYKGFE